MGIVNLRLRFGAAFLLKGLVMQNDHLNLYNINIKYVRNLSKADDRVLSVSPQEGKGNRPLVGIVVICNKKSYCILFILENFP